MKKWPVILSGILVLVMSLAFFMPVAAASSSVTFSKLIPGSSKTYSVHGLTYSLQDDGTNITVQYQRLGDIYSVYNSTSYTYTSGSFSGSCSFNVPISAWNGSDFSLPSSIDSFSLDLIASVSDSSTSSFTQGSGKFDIHVDNVQLSYYGKSLTYYPSGVYAYLFTYEKISPDLFIGFSSASTVVMTINYTVNFSASAASSSQYVVDTNGLYVLGYVIPNFTVTFHQNGVNLTNIYGYTSNVVSSSDLTDQTDTLTKGYDNSQTSDDNTALSGSLSEYNDLEGQVNTESVSRIDSAQFVQPSSAPAQLLTAITFSSSFLQSLFVASGDWSFLILISLAFAFGLMLVGWWKYRGS